MPIPFGRWTLRWQVEENDVNIMKVDVKNM